jgi:hypothetical protein
MIKQTSAYFLLVLSFLFQVHPAIGEIEFSETKTFNVEGTESISAFLNQILSAKGEKGKTCLEHLTKTQQFLSIVKGGYALTNISGVVGHHTLPRNERSAYSSYDYSNYNLTLTYSPCRDSDQLSDMKVSLNCTNGKTKP